MNLDQLPRMLAALREESRWKLVVHPTEATAAHAAVHAARLGDQVLVVPHRYVPQGQAFLVNPAALWRDHFELWDRPAEVPIKLPERKLSDVKTA
jgi:hypothetical protein